MVEFKNAYTGTQMWVADDRVDEYLAAGHKLAANDKKVDAEKPAEKKPATKAKKPTVKKTTKK